MADSRGGSAARELTSPVERRRTPRVPVVLRVDYSTVDSFFSEFTANINEGGVFIESEAPHPVGASVSLQFHLPECADPIKVQGRVAWVGEGGADHTPGMGIEFEDLDETARIRINQLVRRLRVNPVIS